MRYTKQLLALLMAGVLLTVTAGCDVGTPVDTSSTSATTTTATPTTPPVTGPTEPPPNSNRFLEKIPDDLNFANMGLSGSDLTVQIAYVEGTNGEYTRRSLQVDMLDSTTVDQKTRDRNNLLEGQLGLNISITRVSENVAGMEQALGAELVAGTSKYDILAGYQYFGIRLASHGFLLDVTKLSQQDADYIDLQAPYWANAYNEAMSYKGAYYWITGDLALRYTGGAYCTFVNTALYEQYIAPDHGDIFDVVRKGDWTLDLLTEMATQCYVDNGSTAGKRDADDTYGFGYEPNDMMDGLVIGAGLRFTEKDRETGELSLVLSQKDEGYKAFTAKLLGLTTEPEQSYQYPDQDAEQVMRAFADGKLLFTVNKLFHVEKYLNNTDNLAVIPMPKLDTDQQQYRTTVHDGCTIFGITYCSERVAQAAAALEFLSAHSYSHVRPAFYNELIKNCYDRDVNQAEMLDLIHDGITTDFAVAWGQSLDSLIHLFRDYKKGVDNTIARNREDWGEDLTELTESLSIYAESQS